MANVGLIDVGELGWSLELSAHARYLTEHGDKVEIMTYPDRAALYPFAHKMKHVPHVDSVKDGLGIRGVTKENFEKYLEYPLPKEFEMRCKRFWGKNTIFQPYSAVITYPPEILIFPRKRPGLHAKRNLPESFYAKLAKEFEVTSIGRYPEAYKVAYVHKDYVSRDTSVQDVIDHCENAICAVGSQSSLPLISLLQGVPTFIIGDEERRMTIDQNWQKTKVKFYKTNFRDFDENKCVKEVCAWISSM